MDTTMLTREQELSIVNYIKDNYKIPDSGFIAGQAVASLVYRALNMDIPFFINDIDVFSRATGPNEWVCSPKTSLLKLNGSSFISRDNKYGRYYAVVSSDFSKDDPDVNLIEYDCPKEQLNDDEHFFDLIGAFDFNCCAVGFNIEDSKFCYHDAFLSFVKTKQLRVLAAFTPYHSFLRIFKKIKDLKNVHCDIDTEIKVLGSSSFCVDDAFVGSKFKSLFNQIDHEYKQYIELTPYTENYDKVEFSESFFDDLNIVDIDKIIEKKLQPFRNKNRLVPNFFCSNPCSVVHLYHILNETNLFKKGHREKIKSIIFENQITLFCYLLKIGNNPVKVIDDFHAKDYIPVVKLFKKHPLLFDNYNDLIFSDKLIESSILINSLKPEEEFIIGMTESRSMQFSEFLDIIHSTDRSSVIRDIIKQRAKNKNIKKILGNFNILNTRIKQLTSQFCFDKEGKEMHHCVSGYFDRANDLRSPRFYFSITTVEGRSTLEILYDRDTKKISILQHLGRQNEETSEKNSYVAYLIIKYLTLKFRLVYKDCDFYDKDYYRF